MKSKIKRLVEIENNEKKIDYLSYILTAVIIGIVLVIYVAGVIK